MTTLTEYRAYYEVLARVDRVRSRLRRLRVGEGVATFAAVLGATVLGATLIQGFLRFGAAGRVSLLLVVLGMMALAFWRCVVRPLRYDPNDKEIARFLETRLPPLGNDLINAILLAEDAESWSSALVERAIAEAAAGARGVDLMAATSARSLRRRVAAAAGVGVALAVFVLAAPGRFASAGLQILAPLDRHIASVGAVTFRSITPEDVAWIKGDPLDIVAVIEDPHGTAYDGVVELRDVASGEVVRKDLVRAAGRLDRFAYRVPQVLRPFRYRLTVGGTESGVFEVTVREPPRIEGIDVVYTYPDYTGLVPQRVADGGGEIRCLVGTRVDLTVRLSAPVEGGVLLMGSGETVRCMPVAGRRALTARLMVMQNGTYRVRAEGDGPGTTSAVYPIAALADEPPTIQFTMPGRDVEAGAGEAVKLSLKAADRYGLGEVRLLAQVEGAAGEPAALRTWKQFADPMAVVLDDVLALDPATYRTGQVVVYWAEATDRRTYQGGDTPRGPNVARTPKFKIAVRDRRAAAEDKLTQLTRLFERLRTILEHEVQARAVTETILAVPKTPAEVRAAGVDLGKAQAAIRAETVAVVREVVFDGETAPLRETLEVLAANEMAAAIAKAVALAEVDAGEAGGGLAEALAADQDAIVAVLRQMLDIVPRLEAATKAEAEGRAASDLPPETLDKLRALHDRLLEFVDAQKKVVEATADLAKRPVDDFQEADQKELERLAAVEDQWDRFLTEAISALQKVPDLDASNPSLVKELIEVKVDVEMAKDALARKAMDVVVAMEDLGRENAEEIVENLERWLPDTPDRQRWQQEEMVEDAEIAHAELPAQMEDLVGELMEEEEDLFDELEDVTSGLADSMDKGAGWDAMDGPISNYSAKGVTGNRLPNSSEMGGRSGEGRTGKSSGEFVEEEATGKGGRRTPTRLTPDAFSQGEVKDTSSEAAGGATGGGKISGAGAAGLEGPVPREVQRRMGRLAGRQADLRNKAEGVRAALTVRNYESFALGDAIEAMRKVQRDLLAGRYTSALRRKNIVLGRLKDTQMLLGGEIRVRHDTSAALPTEVQKDVLDALEKPMPRGYEAYLKRYYERLSEGAQAPPQ